MSRQDLGIVFRISISIILLPKCTRADVSGDTGVPGTMIALRNALPSASVAILGAWAVLQYTRAWDVDDGPLSGVLAWWRWKYWMPLPAFQPTLSPIKSSGNINPARRSRKYTHMPMVSYQTLITCYMLQILITTSKTRGMFFPNHGTYASALFGVFIIAWCSLTRFVQPVSIPPGFEDGYNSTLVTYDIHDEKSRTLNALAGIHDRSVYGVMARIELRQVKCTAVSNFLKGRRLCGTCRRTAEEWEAVSWGRILELLQQKHSSSGEAGEQCEGRPPFRWMRGGTGSEEPLRIQDPDISVAIIRGGLGAWRIKPAHRLLKTTLFLAILFPLCLGFQVIFALLGTVVPIFGYCCPAPHGSFYYIPLHRGVQFGLYLPNGTLFKPLPQPTDPMIPVQWSLFAAFAVTGAVVFVVGCLEAFAAQRTDPKRVLSPRGLRRFSCGMIAFYGIVVGICLSFTSGWFTPSANEPDEFGLGLEFTFALLISGIFLGGSFIWRAWKGKEGDVKSWVIPPFHQTDM